MRDIPSPPALAGGSRDRPEGWRVDASKVRSRKCQRLLGQVDGGGFPAGASHNRGNEAQGGACLSVASNPRAGVNARDSNREKLLITRHSHSGAVNSKPSFQKMSSFTQDVH